MLNMELDKIIDKIIEESGKESEKQQIAIKPKLMYKIGTEIETVISGYDCESCSYCAICDNCPVCEYCQNEQLYCERCNPEDIRDYAIRHGYLEENDDRDICEVCQENYLWQELVCDCCDRCSDCEYIYNRDYCPYNDYYSLDDIDISKIEPYLDNYYYDESCGMEFVTKPFSSLKDYWHAIKAIVQTVGKENIDISEKCGGHINISWTNGNKSWLDYDTIIASNILFFSDLLSYMFCFPDTYERYEYKEFPDEYDNYKNHFINKYCCVHLKDYAVEIRFPDSPKDVDNHVLLTATLLAISLKTYEIPFDKPNFNKTKEIYEKINYYGKELNKLDKLYLRNKFKLLIKFIRKPLIKLSKELGVNLLKALEYRFKYPKYEESTDSEFDLSKFAIKQNTKYRTKSKTTQLQTKIIFVETDDKLNTIITKIAWSSNNFNEFISKLESLGIDRKVVNQIKAWG